MIEINLIRNISIVLKYAVSHLHILRQKHLYGCRFCSNKSPIPTMKYLNVAEKNDAAKNIALHLSRGTSRRREGYSTYNKIYEFETDVLGQRSTMVMTSVSGHLLGYEFVGSYKGWKACNPLTLFEAPLAKTCPQDYQKIKQTLEREVRGCHGLIIWTDCDREGENIGFEIIQVCKDVKSTLKIYRAKFSEITSQSVNRALQTLGPPNKAVSDAVDVRQELDLRIGAAFTRFQTLRLQQVFPEQLTEKLVSYGSCQFPTLGFVVERYRAVQSFIAEMFWKIKVSHTLNNLSVDFTWKRGRLFDEQACIAIHDVCTENPLATVRNIKSKPKSKWRPLPLDTIEMEKLGSRKLKINAKETMKIAEKLYTQGIISYPRTETNIYPKELNLSNLVSLQCEDADWGGFARGIMESGGPTPRQGTKCDQAHPPIHPTKHVTNLSGNERKVYELIVRSFLACCSKDAQGHETVVEITIAEETFTASGLMIIARNYLDVYPYDKWSGKEIHVYEEGQTFDPTVLEVAEGQTSAPNLLTESDLIALMEKHGIGTDATHADHIETIKNRSYVALADNIHFVPSLLGMGLVEGYDSMGLSFSKPHLRAGLEADLKEVCAGRKQPQAVLAEQVNKYRDVFVTVTQEATKIDQALSQRFNQTPAAVTEENNSPHQQSHTSLMKCPKCRSDMTLRSKKDGQGLFIGCMGFPNCKNVIWLPAVVDKVEITNTPCEECGPSVMKVKFKWNERSLERRYPSPYLCCIGGCDIDIIQTLNINPSSVRNNISANPPAPSSSSRVIPNNRSNTSAAVNSTNSQRNNSTTNNSNNRSNHLNTWLTSTNSQSGITVSNNNRPVNQTSGNTNNSLRNTRNDSGYNSHGDDSARFNATSNRTNNASNPATPCIPTNNSAWSSQLPAGDGDNNVVCNCGDPALLLTVRKATPNMGRQFYKCQKPKDGGGCDFFLWASPDETNEGQGERNNLPRSTSETNSWGTSNTNTNGFGQNNSNNMRNQNTGPPSGSWNSQGDGGINDTPKCQCNLPSKQLTVNKEGPNKGRIFYSCPNSMSNRCNFFQWADDQPQGGSSSNDTNTSQAWGGANNSTWQNNDGGNSNTNNSWQNNQQGSTSNSWGETSSNWHNSTDGGGDVPMCQCNIPSKKITVFKEGPNKGRLFYSCSKPMPNRCSFFQWADDQTSFDTFGSSTSTDYGSTRGSRGRGRGRGRSSSRGGAAGGEDRSKRKCGNCRQEGHTRNKCPRLQ